MDRFLDSTLFDVLVALAVPVLWGLLSAWVFDLVRARKERVAAAQQCPPAEGHEDARR